MDGLTAAQALSLYSRENPFVSPAAFANSNYSLFARGGLVRLLDWREPSAKAKVAHNSLRACIAGPRFSCVGARAAIASAGYRFAHYRSMTDAGSAEGLARDLCAFAAEFPYIDAPYKTFIAAFEDRSRGETGFERSLWTLLQALHDLDARHFAYAPAVSSDPQDPHFAFSFAGLAFFAVGMHPDASRKSRRMPVAAIAFNAHAQFRALRETGHFEKIRRAVRERELSLQGSLNPNLAEYGERSEARQYSGRAVEETWACPFHPR